MDIFFLILLGAMLLLFGYAQFQKNVVKAPGKVIDAHKEEKMNF